MVQQDNSLERDLQRGTKQIDITSENVIIDDKEKGCMDNSHVS